MLSERKRRFPLSSADTQPVIDSFQKINLLFPIIQCNFFADRTRNVHECTLTWMLIQLGTGVSINFREDTMHFRHRHPHSYNKLIMYIIAVVPIDAGLRLPDQEL